jgi:hypothetical protein
VYKRVPPSSLR